MRLFSGSRRAPGRGLSWRGARRPFPLLFAVASTLLGASAVFVAPLGAAPLRRQPALARPNCPWAAPDAAMRATPDALASAVLAHMDLAEKLTLVDLAPGDGYENRIPAIPALCLPAFTLQDGPNGLSKGDTGVTQLPASLGIAASFDPSLAYSYGQVLGSEAHGQGVDVVQGPNLNIDRVPESGRAFEGYGEDPFLVSQMGVADIEGIQCEGVMANAKHFTAYNQETDRAGLDEQVSQRALEEIYLAPFKAAVTVAHVASIMCAYGSVNSVNDCSDPALFRELYHSWGFTGFVRSDLGAVPNAPLAFSAGLDLVKPGAAKVLAAAVADHALPIKRLNDAVHRLLSSEFSYQLIEHPLTGHFGERVNTRAHAQLALSAAESSVVLLKNDGVLPLAAHKLSSIAVIGSDASGSALTAGGGGAHVDAPFVSTPLKAIENAVGRHAKVTFAAGGASISELPLIPASRLSFLNASSHSGAVVRHLATSRAFAYAATGLLPQRFAADLNSWSGMIHPGASGTYELSLTNSGDTWLYVNHKLVLASTGLHSSSTWTIPVQLQEGRPAPLSLRWFPRASGAVPVLGWRYVSPDIASAVTAAQHAKVAVVFANDYTTEGTDRPTLSLPGDENALISAVAAVNPHTVVVLNTGGPVLMPWLSKVSAVLEAWYPGEEDGAAISAVLFGRVDPSAHLPVTFPATGGTVPTHSAATWPGIAGVVSYSEGLNVGYRYQQTHGLTPLFPFGFGLSYTTFSESGLRVAPDDGGYDAVVTVRNLGSRAGTDVVQGYLSFPAAAGEPPRQLKTFVRVPLAPHAATTVTMPLPPSAFTAYLGGTWQALPGDYTLSVGESSANLPLSVSLSAPGAPSTTGNSGSSAGASSAATGSTGGSATGAGAAVPTSGALGASAGIGASAGVGVTGATGASGAP